MTDQTKAWRKELVPTSAGLESMVPVDGARRRQDPQDAGADGGEAIWVRVVKLIAESVDAMGLWVERAQEHLAAGNAEEALAALRVARDIEADVRRALESLRRIGPRWREESKHFSMVKVRVLRARPMFERLSEEGDSGMRAWGRVLGGLTSFAQNIDAEITEIHTLGSAYHPQAMLGGVHRERRRDLRPGQEIMLETDRRETGISIGRRDEGEEYWVVIMPPLAKKAIPRALGTNGRSEIIFAMGAATR